MMFRLCVVFLVVALLQTTDSAGPKCFSCSKVPYPRDCDTVVQCGDHQECGVEEVVLQSGHVVFNVGCQEKTTCQLAARRKRGETFRNKRDDILTCLQCCDEGYCNKQGCGVQGFAIESRGPYCFHCSVQLGQNMCDTVTVCGDGQKCLIQTVPPFPGVSETVYKTGCAEEKQCSLLNSMSVSTNTCASCCNQDFCNTKCISGAAVAQSTRETTTAPVTTLPIHPETSTVHQQISSGLTDAECSAHGNHYHNVHSMCIKMHNEQKTWYEAVEICNNEKARLIVMDDEQKAIAMRNHLNGHSQLINVWIGLNDRHNTSTFTWQSGNKLTYSDWGTLYSQQPDGGKHGGFRQNCVIMYHNDGHRWHDTECWNRAGFICEAQNQSVNGGWTPYTDYSTCHFEGDKGEGHMGKRHESSIGIYLRKYRRNHMHSTGYDGSHSESYSNSWSHDGSAHHDSTNTHSHTDHATSNTGHHDSMNAHSHTDHATSNTNHHDSTNAHSHTDHATSNTNHHDSTNAHSHTDHATSNTNHHDSTNAHSHSEHATSNTDHKDSTNAHSHMGHTVSGGASHEHLASITDIPGHLKHHRYRSCMDPPPSGGGSLCGTSQHEHFVQQTTETCSSRVYGHIHQL